MWKLRYWVYSIAVCGPLAATATAQNIKWIQSYDNLSASNRGWDEAFHIHVLADESCVLTGLSTSGGDSSGTFAYFAKLDNSGNLLSNSFYGDADPLTTYAGYELHPIDNETGFIFAGRTNANGYDQILLMRLDENLSPVWSQTIGSFPYEQGAFAVQRLGTDRFVLAGFRCDTAGTASDLYVALTDDTGWVTHEYELDSGSVDVGRSVKVDHINGGLIATGYLRRSNDMYDMVLVKLDDNLNEEWVKVHGGSGGDFGEDLKVVSDGYVICGAATRIDSGLTKLEAWLVKTDFDGNVVWEHDSGLSEVYHRTYAQSVIQQPNGSYVLVGTSQNEVDPALTFLDMYVAAVDANGNLLWHREFGGNRADYGYWIQPVDASDPDDSGFVICGTSFTWVEQDIDTSDVFAMRIGHDYICGDVNGEDDGPDISDLTALVDFLFNGISVPYPERANVDGSRNADGTCVATQVDISDLTYFVDFLFEAGPRPMCPWCETP